MTNTEKKSSSKSNSGFVYGLTIGAVLGALSTILINKSEETELINNFESKIKEFFQDLIDNSTKKEDFSSKKTRDILKEEQPSISLKKKIAPKMFVKPKK